MNEVVGTSPSFMGSSAAVMACKVKVPKYALISIICLVCNTFSQQKSYLYTRSRGKYSTYFVLCSNTSSCNKYHSALDAVQ